MKSLAIVALKDEGHKLIDQLVDMGTNRTKVYNKMKKRLKRDDGSEHFGQMKTIEEVEEAVQCLRMMIGWKMEALAEIKNPTTKAERRRKRIGVMLPHDDMQRAFAEMRAARERPQTHRNRWTRAMQWLKIKLWA